MTVRIEVGYKPPFPDPRGLAVLGTIRSFLHLSPSGVRSYDVYTVDAELTTDEAMAVRQRFTDPVVQHSAIDRLEPPPCDFVVWVGFRPGVTDAVGRSAMSAISDLLQRPLGPEAAVYTSRLYFISDVSMSQAQAIATGLLANGLIEHFEVRSIAEYLAAAPDLSVPAVRSTHEPSVITIDLGVSDDELLRISRERVLSLTLDEMKTIQAFFARPEVIEDRAAHGLGAAPTDVELECLAQTWSEHCKHKIFNAHIHYQEPATGFTASYSSLFKQHIRRPTEAIRQGHVESTGRSWLVSVFHDNAGVIAFNGTTNLVYKVETHNSPSALDPYGGAMTGIVGVNRDPFGTGLGAELLVNVWGYCFADPRYDRPIPQGLMHPRRIRDGVHQGVIDGGNQSGIPYGRGWEIFDDRYLGKPLVYCGTVGRMPALLDGQPSDVKHVHPGDRVIMCGGRIGKDGIHGATFSSVELHEDSPVQAVQIGDPITQKRMFDFLLEARDRGLYGAITDNGAGGLSSSVGELCLLSGGAALDLARAPLKYAGLDPWEVLISEAQERMTIAVPPAKLDEFLELARRREVEATDIGVFTDAGLFEVAWAGVAVARLPLDFLHDGLPPMQLTATWNAPSFPEVAVPEHADWSETLTSLLRGPNLASGEKKARHYDHEVKGLSVVKPFVGVGCDMPSDASVFLAQHGSLEGFVLSEGINPFYSDIDTRWMTASVVDEAVRKAVGAGARLDLMAGLDNYCWPDPVRNERTPDGEYKLAQLVRSTAALAEFCQAYGVPCISGKDSMKNDSSMGGVKISIPPTLLFSVIGKIDDVTRAVTVDAKTPGAVVFLLGITREELGGSELYRHLGAVGNEVPKVLPQETLPLYRTLSRAIEQELVQSCCSPARGGLAVALAKVAMGGELGLRVELDLDPHLARLSTAAALFSESNGRFVVTVAADLADSFQLLMDSVACVRIGTVEADPVLVVRRGGRDVLAANVLALKAAWKETFDAI